MATAHNTARRSLGLYKLLAALQYQGVAGNLGWDWGPLASCPFLPRVVHGRLVLARARWELDAAEVRELATIGGPNRLRQARRLPRRVAFAQGDNELWVDLDSPASVDIALHGLGRAETATVVEVASAPEELTARGKGGWYCHELIVPFHRLAAPPAPAARLAAKHASNRDAPLARRFPPGSEWLYLKAYCGRATADAVLRDAVAPAIGAIGARAALPGWFFVREGDPDWHLRVRVAADPNRLRHEIQPQLLEALAPFVADGRVWRVQLDTYEREVERYGGPAGMALAEEAFCADSDAAVAIVSLLSGDGGADARWRLTLLGTDLLLADLGFSVEQRRQWARSRRDGFMAEFAGAADVATALGKRFRAERADLETLLSDDPVLRAGHRLNRAVELLEGRSQRLVAVARNLRVAADAGDLTVSIESWADSVAHMHANRLLRSAARAQELVIVDFLERLYRSRLARPPAR